MKKWVTIFLLDLTAVALGILLSFAFAPYYLFPLAIIAPAGLLALWLNSTKKRAFYLGYLFGIGSFGAGVYWVYNSIHDIGGVPTALAIFITAAFIAILSLFPASVGYITNRYFPTNNRTKLIYAFPAVWVFSEWVRSFFFTGFPWLFIGYSQTNSQLKGYAAIFSVYGVSLAALMTSALLVNGYLQYQRNNRRSMSLNLLAILGIWLTGGLLSFIPWTKPIGNPISMALVQGNIPQTIKWSPEHLQLSLDTYEELTAPLWKKDELIVWPEAAVPLPLQYAQPFINSMLEKAKAAQSNLILGIPFKNQHGNGFFNAIIVLGDDKQVYFKRNLVPFGEYTPQAPYFTNMLNFMNIPISETVNGRLDQGPIEVNGVKILPSICYEIAYPELIRSNDKTVGFLLTVTNDAWFGRSNAEAQHLQMAQMRALELGRPVVFVSNDGITAIIGPDGKIQTAAPQHEAYVLHGKVQPMFGVTPWMHNGIDPILFIMLCFLFSAIRARKNELKSQEMAVKENFSCASI